MSATETAWERTPWHAAQNAAWEGYTSSEGSHQRREPLERK